MRHRVIGLLGRRTFQLYVVVLVGLFCYLHYCRYGKSGSSDGTVRVELASKSSSRDLFSQSSDGGLQHQFGQDRAPRRFILSLNYWEQFTMATFNLLSLVCLGSKWNTITVQPYTFNSRLYGVQNFKPGIY